MNQQNQSAQSTQGGQGQEQAGEAKKDDGAKDAEVEKPASAEATDEAKKDSEKK